MKVSKFDIGAEIISILTKGMYPDPRDAVREYIQNAIDAGAKSLDVKIRQNSVVIEDNGVGMDYATLRKSIRVGVSDKKPGKDIGFMGIGIYSSFHLCDKLLIFTKQNDKLPQSLEMDFKGMRDLLTEQKEKRLAQEIRSEDLTDLQTLLEKYIDLPEEGTIADDEYPVDKSGTRVELVGLNPVLDDLLNNFDEISNYLEDVVPLKFNNSKFHWGPTIEKKIAEIAKANHSEFNLIDLNLQVGSRSAKLYRPYTDDVFSNNTASEPDFLEIRSNNIFIGLAWGCLNSTRDRIKLPAKDFKGRNLRGFLLKKQGFSIGQRDDLSKYFGNSNTHYHRYTGEIIILNEHILPNAARNDLEASELKKAFILQLQTKVAPHFVAISNKFQESDRAKQVMSEQGNLLKEILATYNPYNDNYHVYVEQVGKIDDILFKLKIKKSKLKDDDKREAEKLIHTAEKLRREILAKFQELTTKKKSKAAKNNEDVKVAVASELSEYTAGESEKFESLIEMLETFELDLTPFLKKVFEAIDDKFIQASAGSKSEYYDSLNQLKNELENE